ncbi:MAG: DMT family transporter [Negativicutes bacterium]|nr:DMT family transporter [Negativicutes bacterium]
MNRKALGYGAVLLAAVLFGIGGSVFKYVVLCGVPAVFLIKVRLGGTALALLVGLMLFRRQWLRVSRQDIGQMVALGVFGFTAFMGSAMMAVSMITVGLAVFLQFLAPALVAAYQRFFCHQPLPRATVLAMWLSLLGGGLMVGGLDELEANELGVALALASALFYAFNTVKAKQLSASYPPVTILFYGMAVAAVIWLAVPAGVPWDGVWSAPPWMYAYVAFGYTLLPYALLYAGIYFLPPVNVGITAASEPIIAGIVAFFTIGEVLSVWQILGGAMVVAAVVLLQLTDARRPTPPGRRRERNDTAGDGCCAGGRRADRDRATIKGGGREWCGYG